MKKLVARLQLALLERRTIRVIVGFLAISVSIYLGVVLWFGWDETVTAFAALGLQTLMIGAVLSSSAYLWRFGRWEYSLRCLENTVPRLSHLGIYLSGLALAVTPGRLGETFRSALLIRHGVSVTHSLAAFLVDKGSDVLGMILLGTLAAVMAMQHHALLWLVSFAFILLGSCSFSYLLSLPLANPCWDRFGRSMRWLPIMGGQAVLEAWSRVWKPPRVFIFSAVAMLAHGTQALVFYWFCQVLGTGISFVECVLIFAQSSLIGAASMIPGGLVAMEAALVFELVERSVSNGAAISLAISIRLVTFWFGVLLGLLSLVFINRPGLSRQSEAS